MKKKSQMHTSREIVNLIAKFIIEYSIRKCMAACLGIKKLLGRLIYSKSLQDQDMFIGIDLNIYDLDTEILH